MKLPQLSTAEKLAPLFNLWYKYTLNVGDFLDQIKSVLEIFQIYSTICLGASLHHNYITIYKVCHSCWKQEGFQPLGLTGN